MKCPSCGREIPSDSIYCPYCGLKISDECRRALHEKLKELKDTRSSAVFTAVVSVLSIFLAVFSFYFARLPLIETEWRCIATFYGTCILHIPEFRVSYPHRDFFIASGTLFIIVSVICAIACIYYINRGNQITNTIKESCR